MTKKHRSIAAAVVILGALLIAAWWGWSKLGLAALQLNMGVC